MRIRAHAGLLLLAAFLGPISCAAQSANRITILYDAFGKSSALKKDWGFSALVEYGGKRILFDTGNNADTLAQNVKVLGVDLQKLDFVVVSHRHGDHIGGLNYLLSVNPAVRIYAPREIWGTFGGSVAIGEFYRHLDALPAEQRYFDGAPPQAISSGVPWPRANLIQVDSITEIVPGIYLIPTVSQTPGTLELRELTLVVRTPKGQILVAGCSHPGVEQILEAAAAVDPHIYLVCGGLHLLKAPDAELERLAVALHDRWKVERLAPGHCTGEPAFAIFQRVFGDRYSYAGLGSIIELP